MKRLTLEEIGAMAGVSRSTVSRVVNGQPDVSPKAKQRVLDVIEGTGFRPNQAARSLVSSRSSVLGLVIPSAVHNLFSDPYFGRLIRGITSAANRHEQTLSLFLFEDEREEMDMYPRVVSSGLVDGLIVTATKMHDPLVERLSDDVMPVVMVGRPDRDGIAYADADNTGGSRLATEHLIEHGRRRIVAVGAPIDTTTGLDRQTGFLQAMADAGLAVAPEAIVDGNFTEEGGFAAASVLLELQPDAMFCASDSMALGALRAIEAEGLRCPDDVAVVSFDGLLDADASTPSLTSVRQPVPDTGIAAVELLLGILEDRDEAEHSRMLPTELIVRGSCGCENEEAAA